MAGGTTTNLLIPALAAAALAALAAALLLWRRLRAAAAAPAPLAATGDDGADLLAAFADPLLVVRDRRVLIANQAARDLLGAHITGSDVRLAIRHPAAAEHLARDEEGGEPVRIELVGLGELGRPWELAIAPLPGGSRLVRLIDQSQARAAEQMRVDFVANASHELRTPLATLIGFIETLQDEAAVDPATRQRFVGDHGRRGGAHARPARRSDVAVADRGGPLRRAARDGRPQAAGRGGARGAEAPRARAARSASSAAPARHWSPATAASSPRCSPTSSSTRSNMAGRARTIRVRLADAGPDLVSLSVIDRGEGIAAAHIPRLTERFYRVDPGRSRQVGGTGLGLAIVKHIVLRHRGRLDIRSKVGEGTRVEITLPRAAPG